MRSRRTPRLVSMMACLALSALGADAAAQDSAASAESLFDEGRHLLAESRFPEACAKFAESERLDPGIGTLLNLGDCYEKMGKIATAWAVFKEATSMAIGAKQATRERIATTRAAALEPKIPRLTIRVLHPEAGLEVRRDGVLLGPTEWSNASPSAIATDPGDHKLDVSAPGMKAWTTTVTLAADGKTTSVDVPPLEADALADRAPLQPRHDASVEAVTTHDRNVQRGIGIVLGAVGALSFIVGVPLGARAITLNNEAKSECPTNSTCQGQGASNASSAVFSGTLSTVLMSAGVAIAGGGIVLYLTAPQAKRETHAVRLVPSFGPGGIGLSGSF